MIKNNSCSYYLLVVLLSSLFFILQGWLSVTTAQDRDELLNLLKATKQPQEQARYLYEIALTYDSKDQNKYEEYVHKAYQKMKESRTFEDVKLKVKIINSVGYAYMRTNDGEKSNEYFFEAADVAKKANREDLLRFIYNNIGYVYNRQRKHDKALEYQLMSLAISEKMNDTMSLADNYTNIGVSYTQLKNYDKAEHFFKKSLEASQSINYQQSIIIGYANLGDVALEKKAFDKALSLYLQSLALSETEKLNYDIMYNKERISHIYIQMGELEKAQQYALEALDLAREYGYVMETARIYQNLSEINKQKEQWEAAIMYTQKGLEIAKKSQAIHEQSTLYTQLNNLYRTKGNYQQALVAMDSLLVLKDSIAAQENIEAFAEMEAKFQLDIKERENAFLKEEAQMRKRQNRLTVMASVLGLMLLTALAYSFYRKRASERRQKEVLERKVQERTQHLKITNAELKQAYQGMERFAFVASHDLREPLRNIMSFSNLAQRRLQAGKEQDLDTYLGFIGKGAKQMEELLKDIHDFFVVTQKQERNQVQFHELINMVKTDLRLFLKEHEAILTTEIEPGATQATLPKSINLVLKNLIENAVKYNESKPPKVTVIFSRNKGDYVVQIKDNGIGIDPAYHQQVFEMFSRLHNRKEHAGSGIGLAICDKIISKHGGRIYIKESSDAGTTFEFVLSEV